MWLGCTAAAPEIITDSEGYDFKVDCWSLGVILYAWFVFRPRVRLGRGKGQNASTTRTALCSATHAPQCVPLPLSLHAQLGRNLPVPRPHARGDADRHGRVHLPGRVLQECRGRWSAVALAASRVKRRWGRMRIGRSTDAGESGWGGVVFCLRVCSQRSTSVASCWLLTRSKGLASATRWNTSGSRPRRA